MMMDDDKCHAKVVFLTIELSISIMNLVQCNHFY
jgi:hypothetical protein